MAVAISEAASSEVILGLLESVQGAAAALDALIAAGCRSSELGMLMTDRTAERAFGRAEVRDSSGAVSVFSGHVHSLAADLKPLAPLGTVGSGLVAAGPLAALLVSAGLGSQRGLEQALEELGVTADAADAARRVLQGAVLVSAPIGDGSEVQQTLATESALFWRVPLTAPLTRSAVVTEPLAPAPDRSARYRPVIESPDEARRSSVGATKHGT
jgi:hypothetical protein